MQDAGSLHKDILSYIKNEKDIARYKITTLERKNELTRAKKRVLDIEREFVSLPLESLDFEDLADVAAAIKIYRKSRNLFYSIYDVAKPCYDKVNKKEFVASIIAKRDFLIKTSVQFLTIKTQEINLIQNYDFFYDISKRQSVKNGTSIELEQRQLSSLDLKEMLDLEPVTISKKRARVQAAIFSIGRYIADETMDISITESNTIEELKTINDQLDEILIDIENNIFKFFNESLEVLPKKVAKTMGENPYLSKLHSLVNVFDFSNFDYDSFRPISWDEKFDNERPIVANVLYEQKNTIVISVTKDAERGIQNKVFGIIIPLSRKGNEKMSLLHKKIIYKDMDISHMFTDNISNVKVILDGKKTYAKALLMHPFWKLIEMAKTDGMVRHILSILTKFKEDKFEDINFDNKYVIDKVNEQYRNYFVISEESMCLAPKTRSEEEGFAEITSILNSKISEIKDDYKKYIIRTNKLFK